LDQKADFVFICVAKMSLHIQTE